MTKVNPDQVPEYQGKKHAECKAAGDHLGKVEIWDRDNKKRVGFACTHCGAMNTNGERPATIDIVTP